MAKELGYNADQNLDVFSCCVPSHLYLFLKGATTNIVMHDVQDSTDVQDNINIVMHNVQQSIDTITYDVQHSIHILIHAQDSIHIVIIMFENIWKEAQQ